MIIVSNSGIPIQNYWLFKEDNAIEVISFNRFIKEDIKADLVFFHGGEDVSPTIYGEDTIKETYNNKDRDLLECKVYSIAMLKRIPCFGICRGSQFITAMQQGGIVIQDVSGHYGNGNYNHFIKIVDKTLPYTDDIEVTSTHHQMMYPYNTNHELIAISSKNRSSHYKFSDFNNYKDNKMEKSNLKLYGEPEIVYYPDSNSLAIQGHPEFTNKDSEFSKLTKFLIYKKLFKK